MENNTIKHRLKFNDNKSIKRSLSKVANMVINGELKPIEANSIATLCNTILKADKQLELEKDIEELREIISDIEESQKERK